MDRELDKIDTFLRDENEKSDLQDSGLGKDIVNKASDIKMFFHQQEIELEENLKAHLQQLGRQKPARRKYISFFLYLGAAASVILALTFLVNLYLSDTATNEDLFDQYYEPYFIGTMNRGEQITENAKGLEAYANGSYSEAIPSLSLAAEKNPENLNVALALGNSYLMTNQTMQARDVFQTVLESNNKEFRQYAQWYLTLSLLKEGNRIEAIKSLQEIIDAKTDFTKPAKDLLSVLQE